MTFSDTMSSHGSAAALQNGTSNLNVSDFTIKAGLAQMLKGGVIMDVVNAEQVIALICRNQSYAERHSITGSHR